MIYILYLISALIVCRFYTFCLSSGLSKSDKNKIHIFLTITITSVVLLSWLINEWQFNRWKKAIPPFGIEISKNVDSGIEYGLFDGCGFAVFELSTNTLNEIKKDGIEALSNARESEDYKFSEWHHTPNLTYVGENEIGDAWLMGMSCGYPSMNNQLKSKINESYNNKGSFYALASHAGIIVIPKHKLVVISHWG